MGKSSDTWAGEMLMPVKVTGGGGSSSLSQPARNATPTINIIKVNILLIISTSPLLVFVNSKCLLLTFQYNSLFFRYVDYFQLNFSMALYQHTYIMFSESRNQIDKLSLESELFFAA